jgi:hypothetical protein
MKEYLDIQVKRVKSEQKNNDNEVEIFGVHNNQHRMQIEI